MDRERGRREFFGSIDDEDDNSEDQGHEGEEEYEREDHEEVIEHDDFQGDRESFMHAFGIGGQGGDVSDLLARLDPAILASVPQELLQSLPPEALARVLDRSERRAPGEGGSGSSRSGGGSSDQAPSGPPPPPDTNFEGNPSAVLAAISHPQTDPDMLVMALMHLSTMILMNERGIQPSRFVPHICKCFVRQGMPAFIQETCLQVSPPHRILFIPRITVKSGTRQFLRSRRYRSRIMCWSHRSRAQRPDHHAIHARRAAVHSRLP